MRTALLDLLLPLTLWWTAVFVVYALILFGLDALWESVRRHREERRRRKAELARIDREAADAVRRLGAAFGTAQRQLRDDTVVQRGDHR